MHSAASASGTGSSPAAGNGSSAIESRPTVSVVIPVRNEVDEIGAALACLRNQTLTPDEILVVDGMSDDGTREAVLAESEIDPRVRLIDNPDRIIPAALNRGLESATSTYLIRVDAHAYPPDDYLEALVGHLESRPDISGAGGQKVAEATTPIGKGIAVAMASKVGVGNSPYHFDGDTREVQHVPFGAYRVNDARELGGWDEAFISHQDFEFDYRLGQVKGPILLDPSIRIMWRCRETVPALFRQYLRYGGGKAAALKKHPESMRARQVAPAGLVGGLAGSALLGMALRSVKPLLPAGMYAALVAGGALANRDRLDGKQYLGYLLGVPAMHLGWGMGLIRGALVGWKGVAQQTASNPTAQSDPAD